MYLERIEVPSFVGLRNPSRRIPDPIGSLAFSSTLYEKVIQRVFTATFNEPGIASGLNFPVATIHKERSTMTRADFPKVSLTEHNISEVQRSIMHVAYVHIGIDLAF
jgi:hypothetical protein